MDLDPSLFEVASRVLAKPAWYLRQDLRCGVDENPALRNIPQCRIEPKRRVSEVVELRERLDPRVAGADEDETELVRCVRMDHGTFELLQQTVTQPDCVGQVLEAQTVLPQPGDREEAGNGSQRYDQAFVGDLARAGETALASDTAE
jgi:hypothetical protein